MAISDDDPRQKFEQVADALREKIKRGDIRPGQKLNSVRELSDSFHISPTTVQRALAVLRDEGLIYTSGRGTYARDPKTAAQPEAEAAPALREVLRQLEHVTSQLTELRERVTKLEAQGPGRAVENQ